MKYSKKKALGFHERLDVLKKVFYQTEAVVKTALKRYKRKEVAKDDILDSIAATMVACSPVNALSTVPEIPGKDAKGLPMEIVFSQ